MPSEVASAWGNNGGIQFRSRSDAMNLAVWLPALFVLGWVSLFACLAFTEGCGRI